MKTLHGWIVMSWIMLPRVMVGGTLLLRRLTTSDGDPFRATRIRGFHAHRLLSNPTGTEVCRGVAADRAW
jgi:hypothetical protein